MDLVYGAIPAPDKKALKEMILTACQALNAYGITSSQTDDYCVFRAIPWQVVDQAYQELKEENRLTVRVNEQCNFCNLPGPAGFCFRRRPHRERRCHVPDRAD